MISETALDQYLGGVQKGGRCKLYWGTACTDSKEWTPLIRSIIGSTTTTHSDKRIHTTVQKEQ